jgi:hypothetical protein
LRAQQTWEAIQACLPVPAQIEDVHDLVPYGRSEVVTDYLRALDDEYVLIISHLPLVGYIVNDLCANAVPPMFARLKDRPSSIFQFPGMILLVPGSVGYRSLSFLYEKDIIGGMGTAFTMVTLAMALVVGIFFGNILVKPRRTSII